jgi:hypothetical protein
MRYFFLLLILIITVIIARINIKLYSENDSPSEKRADIIRQLNFLESQLKNDNLGAQMQGIFPEGSVFINALYGLSWCELALSDSQTDPELREKVVHEALYAYNEISSNKVNRTFDHDLIPEYGIFYCGWKNYLLSKILSVDTTFQGHELYINEFKSQCDNIVQALTISKSPFLQSYNSQSWPADMFVAMASLSNHDKIFKSKYKAEIDTWIHNITDRIDPVTHLMPHKVDSKTGKAIQGARGSSMSLILRMLIEIKPELAKEQFKLFKTNFVSNTFGLPSIREYPKGHHGYGDIDSGPVILGVGFSGTIVMIGTFSMLNSGYLAEKQYKTINAFGFGRTTRNQKKYLFGKLPMADAFIAWGRATGLKYKNPSKNIDNWRTKFQVISLLIILLFWIIYFQKKIMSKIKTAANIIYKK